MEPIIAFKALQVAVICIFMVFISDVRRKRPAIPLIGRRAVVAVRLCYPVILGAYAYAIAVTGRVLLTDCIALAATVAGTALVVKAKMDLAGQHSWAGFGVLRPQLSLRESTPGSGTPFIRVSTSSPRQARPPPCRTSLSPWGCSRVWGCCSLWRS
jgi:hypothetical protein